MTAMAWRHEEYAAARRLGGAAASRQLWGSGQRGRASHRAQGESAVHLRRCGALGGGFSTAMSRMWLLFTQNIVCSGLQGLDLASADRTRIKGALVGACAGASLCSKWLNFREVGWTRPMENPSRRDTAWARGISP